MIAWNRVRQISAVVLVAAAAFAAGACGRDETAPETTTTSQQPATTPQAGDPLSDARITTAVQAKYYGDDRIGARDIDVETQNGVVTLSGAVPDEATKQQALSLARSVDGVTSVNDQLEVRTGPVTAATKPVAGGAEVGTSGRENDREPVWITTKIQAQYFLDPEVSPWNIDVTTASGGVVTLEGTVDSAQDKSEAVRIARETEGVTRVDDKLRVRADSASAPRVDVDAPDPWLTAKIQAKYFMDADVKGRRIDVDTQSGVVTLSGTVESQAARRQAVALARNTDGVREVKDQLKVDTTLASSGGTAVPGKAEQAVSRIERPDIWVTTKIQSKYFLDPDVKGHQIDVDTKNGVVTLQGSVDNAAQKQAAEQIATETEGVKTVVNRLTVGGGRS